jgi:hypothetical protein
MERTVTKDNEEGNEERSSMLFRIGPSAEIDNRTGRCFCRSRNSEQEMTVCSVNQDGHGHYDVVPIARGT